MAIEDCWAGCCGRRQWSETSGTEFPLHHLSPLFVRNTPALGLACETTTFMERKKIYRRFCDAISYHARPGMSQLLFSARMPSLILYICKVLYWENVIKCRKKRRGKGNEKGIWQGLFCTGGSHVASRWWSLASGTCHRLPPKSISCPTPCALTFYVETGTFHPVFYLLL